MEEQDIRLYKNWWILGVKGILVVVFGVLVLLMAQITPIKIVKYFGLIILLSGVALSIGSFVDRKQKMSWKWWFFEGLFDILIGALILLLVYHNRLRAMAIYSEVIAFWALAFGIIQIITAFRFHKFSLGWIAMLLSGFCAIGYTVVFVLNFLSQIVSLPGFSSKKIIIGSFAIVVGLVIIINSVSLLMAYRKSLEETSTGHGDI